VKVEADRRGAIEERQTMSRIGKKPVEVPAGVKVSVGGDRVVTIEGPKGTLKMQHRPEVKVAWAESEKRISVTVDEKRADDGDVRAYWGTTRALIDNMIEGVTKGYEKSLDIVGVGWQAQMQGKQIRLAVGFANPIFMTIPAGINVAIDRTNLKISGADKQAVGQFAAAVRAKRKPEPYNGKGIKYTEETIRRKAGKAFGA
jgi:large subunit ribosomal protein L6